MSRDLGLYLKYGVIDASLPHCVLHADGALRVAMWFELVRNGWDTIP